MLFSAIFIGSSSLPTTLTWDALRSILGSSAAKGARSGSVASSVYGLWCLYLTLIVERKSQKLSEFSLYVHHPLSFWNQHSPRIPQKHFLLSNQSSHSFWDSPWVLSRVLAGWSFWMSRSFKAWHTKLECWDMRERGLRSHWVSCREAYYAESKAVGSSVLITTLSENTTQLTHDGNILE